MRLDVSCESSARQRIHVKYQVLFSLKNNEKVFMNVVCCSRDWRFKGFLKEYLCRTKLEQQTRDLIFNAIIRKKCVSNQTLTGTNYFILRSALKQKSVYFKSLVSRIKDKRNITRHDKYSA